MGGSNGAIAICILWQETGLLVLCDLSFEQTWADMTDLRIDAREAENGAVRFRILLPVVALVVFGRGLTGMAQPAKSPHAAPQPDARIDINHASVEELMKAPG